MNVAPTITSLPSPSPKGDPTAAPGTTARMLPDGTGTDLPVDAAEGDTFGRMLSRGMAGLDEVLQGKAVPLSLPTEAGVPLAHDAASDPSATRTDANDRSRGFSVAVTDLVDVEAGTPRSTKAVDDGTDDASAVEAGGRHDDAAANDLAAQLALVSQWAGIAKAPAAQGDAGGNLDLRDKLATVRGTALPTAASTTIRATTAQGRADLPQDAPALPFAVGRPMTRDERGIDVGAKAIVAKSDPTIARASENVQVSIASVVALGEPGTVRTPVDSVVTPTGAFAQQIAAATSAATSTVSSPLTADVSTTPTWNIREQLGTPAWSREVGQATLRIATSDLQSASLQINPEHLGPVDVQVRIDNGVAHLSFNAAHADTRQAIESSRATLDRLFTDQGLKIGDCAVGDSSSSRRNADADASLSGQSQRNGSSRWDQAAGGGNAAADAGTATTITTRLKALGLVDTFA